MQEPYSLSYQGPPAGGASSTLFGGNDFFTSEIRKSARQGRPRYDFLSFLEAAQQNDVDFLAITWQDALDVLGKGATAEVRQSLVNLQMSFAFKRPLSHYTSVDEDALYGWLVREATILRHPAVRRHRNLLDLEGVCWDPSVSDKSLRPVLVFKRAEYGDSREFMASEEGQAMSLADRMSFASDVIDAVISLHKANIIHGDIKPQNVLAFKDEDGSPFPRVSDFGYSSLVLAQDGSAALPVSRPWNAPEVVHHARIWSFDEAKGADAYSLGLLCLWLLFGDKLNAEYGTGDEELFFSEHGINLVQQWKKDGQVVRIATRMVSIEGSMAETEREAWQSFFEAAFMQDGLARSVVFITSREASEGQPWAHPSMDVHAGSSVQHVPTAPPRDFRITSDFLQLVLSHYRLRRLIRDGLEERAEHVVHVEIRRNAAFQLAVCYSIGFGCPRNETDAQKWLTVSGMSMGLLFSTISALKAEQDISYKNESISQLVRNGNLQSLEYGLEYRHEPSLQLVEEEYNREISDLSAALGSDHAGVLNLRMILARLLIDQGRFPEAEQTVRQTLGGYTRRFGPDHQETLRCINVLANILEQNDIFSESKTLHQEALERRTHLLGPNHLESLESARQLSVVLQALGEYEEAESMALRDLEGRMRVLGERHPDVYESMANLASIVQDMGRLDDAVDWNERALRGRRDVLGNEHPQTQVSISNLASALQEMESYERAEELFREDLELSRRTLGDEHLDTIASVSNLGNLYIDMKRYQEAEELTREALAMGEKVQGHDHSATLISRNNLALVLERTERYEEAEEVWRDVLLRRERLFEPNNPIISTSISNLAQNYVHQGRLQEAMDLHEKVLQLRKAQLGETHIFTLESMAYVGHILRVWHRFSEAENLLRTVLRTRISKLGYDHSDTYDALGALVSVLHDQGKVGESQEEFNHFLEAQRAEDSDGGV